VELDGFQQPLKWTEMPVPYYVNFNGTPEVSATEFQAAIARAFATWQAVPTASISYEFAGYTEGQTGEADGLSTFGFLNAPFQDRVLAATSFVLDDVTGELAEADVFFNTTFTWSTSENGDTGAFDVESIALHEIGHLSGLNHTAMGETQSVAGRRRVISSAAVMFPIALGQGDTSWRTLAPDDIAGISDLYPAANFMRETGSISGRVLKNGRGVFGAHIIAFNLATGARVSNFSLDLDGAFAIAGLSPGPHIVRVEPLDDADIESFFDLTLFVDTFFKPTYFERIVVVPKGGDRNNVLVSVDSK
jgi:hypothetical protein